LSCKTLHLTNAYHPTSGGIRTFYRALLREANNQQRPMRLIVPAARDEIEEVGRCGRVYHVRSSPAPAFDRRYRMLWPIDYLAPGGRIAEILRREQPDLVEVCDKYSLFYLAAVLRKRLLRGIRRPVLAGLSCERMDDNVAAYLSAHPAARRFAGWYVRNIYGPPFDYHIANSAYTARELQTHLWDRADDFVRVAPMGVDTSRFDPLLRDPALRRELLARAGGTIWSVLLLYAGRLAPEKNVRLLIDMLEHLVRLRADGAAAGRVRALVGSAGQSARTRDYRLVIAGDGPLADELRADADRRVPGRVLFLGALGDVNAIATHFASADVFIHPNPKEPFGIAPLEAMASGVPVVLPNAGGVLSYACDDNAWLAAPSAPAFADAVLDASTRRDERRILAARYTAQLHDWPAVARQWFALYDDLIARRSGVVPCVRGVADGDDPRRAESASVALSANGAPVAHRTFPDA
jgi:alpha-1,6-mannosyltransferase